jgi:hypothetical protein
MTRTGCGQDHGCGVGSTRSQSAAATTPAWSPPPATWSRWCSTGCGITACAAVPAVAASRTSTASAAASGLDADGAATRSGVDNPTTTLQRARSPPTGSGRRSHLVTSAARHHTANPDPIAVARLGQVLDRTTARTTDTIRHSSDVRCSRSR